MTAKERRALDRLFQIREDIQVLQDERNSLMRQIGNGTHRSLNHPGLILRINRAQSSRRINWRGIATALAKKYGADLEAYRKRYFDYSRRNKSVTIHKDTAKNPKVLPI